MNRPLKNYSSGNNSTDQRVLLINPPYERLMGFKLEQHTKVVQQGRNHLRKRSLDLFGILYSLKVELMQPQDKVPQFLLTSQPQVLLFYFKFLQQVISPENLMMPLHVQEFDRKDIRRTPKIMVTKQQKA